MNNEETKKKVPTVAELAKDVDGHNQRIADIEDKLEDKLEDVDLDDIKTNTQDAYNKAEEAYDKADDVEQRLDNLESKVNDMDDDALDDFKERLTDQKHDIVALSKEVENLQALVNAMLLGMTDTALIKMIQEKFNLK